MIEFRRPGRQPEKGLGENHFKISADLLRKKIIDLIMPWNRRELFFALFKKTL
jgi:hypothetical protein